MRKLNVGVAGLGRAFALMAPTLAADPRVALVAAADSRMEARKRFAEEFGGKVYESVESLCADAAVEVVYVATPHQFHAEHACLAARHGKHLLIEKPMAITAEDGQAILAATRQAGARVVVGHSHAFDAPVVLARKKIAGGEFGRLRMISALNYTDFLYRPRRPEELDSARGGGAVLNQAAHHVDVVRTLAGGTVKSVRVVTGAWDPARPVEGAYAALVSLADGAFATIAYSGYAHFDSDELTGWIGEGGQRKDPSAYGTARANLRGDEISLKNRRNYGGAQFAAPATPEAHPHFGLLVASCEHADLRPTPEGVWIYGDREKRFEKLDKPAVPRAEVIDELYAAVVEGKPPLHDAAWGLATVEVCLAMLRSAREGREIALASPAA